MLGARVAIARCAAYGEREVADRIGELLSALPVERDALRGKRVLVKPNLLAARHPARGVTTHPSVVGAVIDYMRDSGAAVSLGDSPGGAVRGVARVYDTTGMSALAASRGIELVNFEAAGWQEREVDGAAYTVTSALRGFDLIVNTAKFKTHMLTLLTGAVKNTFGCVPGFHKSALHLKHPSPAAMSRAIVDVFSLVRPWLSIMDAVDSMDRNGPSSGRVLRTGLLGASFDAVALDSVFAALIGLGPLRLPVLKEAYMRGLGEADPGFIEIAGGSLEEMRIDGFEVPSNAAFTLVPGVLGKILRPFLWVRPRIEPDRCTGCRRCADMCPAGAISFSAGRGEVDRRKCTSCLCCHEACPEGAVEVEMSRMARMVA
jgi:uncharacterized protein (DUF362 family)/NAD-dependent dihydropyrimidine dehydrogenase PreA subunit